VNWFRHYRGFHAGEWLSLAMVILLALVPGIALLKLVIWRLTPERDKDESRRIIGACMEDKRVVRTQEVVRAVSPPGPQFLAPPRTPGKSTTRKVSLNRSRS
jgi:hypothetical protein